MYGLTTKGLDHIIPKVMHCRCYLLVIPFIITKNKYTAVPEHTAPLCVPAYWALCECCDWPCGCTPPRCEGQEGICMSSGESADRLKLSPMSRPSELPTVCGPWGWCSICWQPTLVTRTYPAWPRYIHTNPMGQWLGQDRPQKCMMPLIILFL